MKRFLLAGLVLVVGAGCHSSGSSWNCHWQCPSDGGVGNKTYPDGPDPTDQCVSDFGADCSDFRCSCTQ